MRNVAVSGSKLFSNYSLLESCLNEILNPGDIILTGEVKGVDDIVIQYANNNGFKYKKFVPRWSKLGKSAGYHNNVTMLKASKLAVIFKTEDDKSQNVTSLINIAKSINLKVILVNINGDKYTIEEL